MAEKKILLVEDNPDDIMLTMHAFKKTDPSIAVEVVNDGVEALVYLFGKGAYEQPNSCILPSLILLDLKMPRVNGLEVLKQLRNNPLTRFIPIVVLTSSREEQDLVDCYTFGANSYIRKPIDFDQFAATIRQIGAYWLNLNEIPQLKDQHA